MSKPSKSIPRNIPKQAATTSRTGKTYLVVGGHGFLGSHVVEALLHRGEDRIRVLDRAPSTLFAAEVASGSVTFIHGDMLDAACVKRACQGVDTVFHTAAAVNFWSDLPFEHAPIYAVNVKGTENVIAACLENGVKQLLHTSSSSVVVPHDVLRRPLVLADESTPYPSAPYLCHYIKTKVEAEQRVREANGRQELLTAAVRPGGLYGPRDPLITPTFAAGLPCAGLPETVVDHIYVENVVHAFLLLEQRLVPGSPVCGQAYFVTNYSDPSPEDRVNERACYEFSARFASAFGYRLRAAPHSLLSMLAWLSQKFTWASRGRLGGRLGPLEKLRPASLALSRGTYYFSHRKATADFGYQPLYSAAEGIEITVGHFLRQSARGT